MGTTNPGYQPLNPGRFRAAEPGVLKIDVVNNFSQRPQCGCALLNAPHQHFEGAAVALMGEIGVEHVKAQLAALRPVAARRHELELGLRVDEASNQPCAGDPVDVDPFARNPYAVEQFAG